MNRIREDVHIHARADAIFEWLDFARMVSWLPIAFREPRIEDGALAFRLPLPLLDRDAHLLVEGHEPPRALVLRAASNGVRPALESLELALHEEGVRNVHVTAEVAYEPAGGPLGGLLEMAVHAPLRRQSLRDVLWRLKLLAEGQVADPASLPGH